MKYTVKLHSISLLLATTLVLSLWTQMPRLVAVLNDRLNSNVLKVTIGVLTSAAIYRMTIKLISFCAERSGWLKKLLLGNAYLNGTWAGFYVGVSGNVHFYVERFEQELDGLVVRGQSYDQDSKYDAHWVASTVNIDAEKGRISYMYECEVVDNKSNHNGVAIFNFERKNSQSPPEKMIGYSADLHIGQRTRSMERRVSSSTNYDIDEALKEAKKLYQANLNF